MRRQRRRNHPLPQTTDTHRTLLRLRRPNALPAGDRVFPGANGLGNIVAYHRLRLVQHRVRGIKWKKWKIFHSPLTAVGFFRVNNRSLNVRRIEHRCRSRSRRERSCRMGRRVGVGDALPLQACRRLASKCRPGFRWSKGRSTQSFSATRYASSFTFPRRFPLTAAPSTSRGDGSPFRHRTQRSLGRCVPRDGRRRCAGSP